MKYYHINEKTNEVEQVDVTKSTWIDGCFDVKYNDGTFSKALDKHIFKQYFSKYKKEVAELHANRMKQKCKYYFKEYHDMMQQLDAFGKKHKIEKEFNMVAVVSEILIDKGV